MSAQQGIRWRPLAVAGIALTAVLAGCGGSAPPPPDAVDDLSSLSGATRAPSPVIRSGVVVSIPDAAAGAVAAGAGYLAWESGPIQSDDFQPSLYERSLPGTATRLVADQVDPRGGLATTREWTFYVRTTGGASELVEVRHDGSGARVLSRSPAAPIAVRGEVVAWAEQDEDSQRVLAMDAGAQRPLLVARFPRCTNTDCFRVGAVTVADRGIVVGRSAIGPHASVVVRRAFSGPAPTSISLAGDPQPDLVPSSAGALYYRLGRGWYRWDFGDAQPRRITTPADPATTILQLEGGRLYWLRRQGCNHTMFSTAESDRSIDTTRTIQGEYTAPPGRRCTELGGYAWTGRQLVTAWFSAPVAEEEGHSDTGLEGAILVDPPPAER